MKSTSYKVGQVKARIEQEFETFARSSLALSNSVEGLERFPEMPAGGNIKPGRIYSLSDEDAKMLFPTDSAGMPLRLRDSQGRKILANEERFTASYYSEPLTTYAVGWTDPEDLDKLIDFIAPRVPVGRRFEFKSAVNVEAFLSELNDDRPIGSEFKEIEFKGSTVLSKTVNRGLRYRLDLDEEGAGILTEELIVSRILQRLKRNTYRRAISTLLAAAAAANTGKVWTYNSSTNPTPQPDEDIRTLIQTTQVTSGVFPNRLLIDLKSWNIRKAAYAAQALAAGAIYGYGRTVDDVVADQSVDGMMVSKALYQSAEWVTPTKSYVLPQNVVAFFAQDNPTRDDPTNLKRFVTPVADGDFRVYRQPVGAKFVDISIEHYEMIQQTATVGIGELTIT
jgi:hypothetical protein